MAEDTSEKVLHDLDLLEIDDLRIMARQNGLQFEGTKAELLSRIKIMFGFENEKVDIEESNQRKKKVKEMPKINESKRASNSSSLPTATAPKSTRTIFPGFVKGKTSGKILTLD